MKTEEKFAGFIQHTGKGVCFAHGPYDNADKSFGCPKWPACITEPHKPEYVAMGTKSLADSETAGLRALVGELRELANRREPVTTDYYCWCETCCKVRAEEATKKG